MLKCCWVKTPTLPDCMEYVVVAGYKKTYLFSFIETGSPASIHQDEFEELSQRPTGSHGDFVFFFFWWQLRQLWLWWRLCKYGNNTTPSLTINIILSNGVECVGSFQHHLQLMIVSLCLEEQLKTDEEDGRETEGVWSYIRGRHMQRVWGERDQHSDESHGKKSTVATYFMTSSDTAKVSSCYKLYYYFFFYRK